MPAPTIVDYQGTTFGTKGSTLSTPSITYQTGDVIVVLQGDENDGTALALPTISGGPTFTNVLLTGAGSGLACGSRIDYAVATSSGSAAVNATYADATKNRGIAAFVLRGCDPVTPIGASNSVKNTTSGTGNRTISLTSQQADSVIIWGVFDWVAGTVQSGTPTPTTTRVSFTDGSTYSASVFDIADQPSTSALNYGWAGSTSVRLAITAVEVRGTTGTSYSVGTALAAAVDYSLRGSGLDSSASGGFEKSAFENTAFYVSIGASYSDSIALAITAVLSDNYALSMFQNATLTITTADVVTNQLNAVATVSLPAAVSASIVGNYIASMALPALSITTAQTTAKTLGISVANTLATTTALAILGGQNVAAAITAALSTSMTDSASVTISGLANYAVTLNAVVAALLNVNGSASFAASLLETSSAVLNAVASEQFALTMSEVASGSLNINAVEALAAALQYNTLAGFTFSSAMALPASLAYALSSSFAYLVSTPLSITTTYSASTLKTAAGLVTLGITTGYALAQSLSAVGSANFPVTTNDVVNTAGSVYGVSIPLHITAQVADVATGVFNSLISMGIHPTLATQAVNIIVQAIAFGITTGMSDDAVKNALQIAALIAEAVTVVQQLTAELVINEQQITAASVSNVQNLTAESVQDVQQLTAESVTTLA